MKTKLVNKTKFKNVILQKVPIDKDKPWSRKENLQNIDKRLISKIYKRGI